LTPPRPTAGSSWFRIDPSVRQDVDEAAAADLLIEPDEFDVDILALGPGGFQTLTRGIIGANFLPVIRAAFEQNPEAECAQFLDVRQKIRRE
jgi:hypothetical protein